VIAEEQFPMSHGCADERDQVFECHCNTCINLDGTFLIDQVQSGSWCWDFQLVILEGGDVIA